MGSPLGPILANVFVGFCEEMIDHEKWPIFYIRYVDYTFTMIHKKEHSVQLFNALNQIHPALQFTMEVEDDGRLPFLDVQIKKQKKEFVRSVYCKPTFSGLYTRWDLFCSKAHKIGLVKSLLSRARRICSKSTIL